MIKPDFTELTGENQFTKKHIFNKGYFSIDVAGEFVGTVTLQRSLDKGKTWYDIEYFILPVSTCGISSEDHVCYRLGIKTGHYYSGTAMVRVG